MWSGGGNATNISWANGEPNYLEKERSVAICFGCISGDRLYNYPSWFYYPFFCFNLIVVEIEKTWETAFSYCRNKHTAFTSLASETEHLLALRKIQQGHITERVWIGLRYLVDRWTWMDGHPSVYRAWDKEDQDNQCPIWKRCAALTKGGVWESRDCTDKLNFICY
ncbi:Dromaiocalcin-1 [Collichthys lucidus]|uniref:Dromaiocalcin-1 n=1 Tax=Collichthys lucidus TaxID=240159 RepID=A0A4U5U3Y6_COLLU|nr:Dromaiocalcin-1 [Collichthys lucidus]